MSIIRVILPDWLEDFFDELIDTVDEWIEPITELAIYILDNFLEFLIMGNLVLLVSGIRKMEEGDVWGIVQPFWNFYGFVVLFWLIDWF